MRLLIAEDEKDLNDILSRRLKEEGYSVDSCFNGEDALDYLLSADYDGAVLDIMMPKVSGLEVLKTLREKQIDMPVLLLTAKDSIEDRVHGLDLGADDYVIKPFAFAELLARLRVMLRKPTASKTSVLQVADLVLHLDTHEVYRGERPLSLSTKEFSLLRYMMQNVGVVLSRERLEEHIWNFDYSGGSNIIDVYIRYLRKKIDEGEKQPLIHTVRGRGYVIKESL